MRRTLIRVTVFLSLSAIQIVQLQPRSSRPGTKRWPHGPHKVNSVLPILPRKRKLQRGYQDRRRPRPSYKANRSPAWQPAVIYDPYLDFLPAVPALIGKTGTASVFLIIELHLSVTP